MAVTRILLLGREGSGKSSFGDFLFKACGDNSGRFSKRIRRGFAASESTCMVPLECLGKVAGKVFVIEAPSAALQSNELKKGEPGWLKELDRILRTQCKSEVDLIVYVHQISERFVQEDKEMLLEFDKITGGNIWDRFLLVFSHASEMGSTVDEEQRKFINDVKESRGAPISFKWLMKRVGDRFETIDFAHKDDEKGMKIVAKLKSWKSTVPPPIEITKIYRNIIKDKQKQFTGGTSGNAPSLDVIQQQPKKQEEEQPTHHKQAAIHAEAGRDAASDQEAPSLDVMPQQPEKQQEEQLTHLQQALPAPIHPEAGRDAAPDQEAHEPDNPLRLLIVGLEGAGKSALGNFLLNDQKFEVNLGFASTPKAAWAHGMICDTKVTIIDTPGLPCSPMDDEWGKALEFAWKGGLDVVLYVHSVNSQFLLEHKKILESRIKEYTWKKVLLVISHAELAGDNEHSQREFVQQLFDNPKCPEALNWLYKKVNQRFVVIDSCDTDLQQTEYKIKEIYNAIQSIIKCHPRRIKQVRDDCLFY